MAVLLRDIILAHIDEALDIDDLENLGDFVQSVATVENLRGRELAEAMKQLHVDLLDAIEKETNRITRFRLKTALRHFEADFSDYLIAKETGTLSSRME